MKERKVFKKNKGLMKRLFSLVLAIALVLNMGQIMPGSTVNAAGTYNATIHFLNNQGWEQVGFYAWDSANTPIQAWPGALATANADHEGWYDGVVTNFAESSVKVIFNNNNNGGQTADLTVDLTAGEEFWVVNNQVLTTAPQGWEKEPEVVEPTTYDATIHYYNNLGWDAVAFYAWGTAGDLGAWPGSVLTENAEKADWYSARVEGFAESTLNVIFNNNNNGSQTADLTVDLTAGQEFWVVNGQVLNAAPNAWTGEGEVEKPYELTFHYYNENNYSGVNFYSWTAGTNAGTWPGVAMSANADHEGWYDYKVVGVSASAIDFILNHASGQTDDLKVDISGKPAEVWVTGTLTKGQPITIATTAPQSWEKQPEVVEPTTYDATVHYYNNLGWEDVAFYAWGTAGDLAAWPGSVLVENAEKAGWYSATVENFAESAINVIFNNNNKGSQTADLTVDLTAGQEFWVVNGQVLNAAPNAWTGEGEVEKPYELTFHYYNANNYSGVNFYSWTAGTNAGTWPGVAMSANADHEGWYDYKVVGVSASAIDFILNHASGQTDDLKVDISGKPAEVWVTGTLTKGQPITITTTAPQDWEKEPEVVEPTTYDATIHFLNNQEWGAVAFYAWDSNENKVAGEWPGSVLAENEERANWFDATVENVKEETLNIIFNNNNNGSQTADITVDLTAGEEFWVVNGQVLTEAPNSWTGEGEPEEPEVYEITFHYENKNGWAGVNFYSWTAGTNTGNWPGAQMTPNEEKLGWYDFKVKNVTAASIDFILNYNGTQTADLNVDISGKPTEIWVSGYYNNLEISTTAPESWTNPGEVVERPSAYNVVVHYNNPNNWTDVSFYSWSGSGNALVGAWPGTAATANTANNGWYDFYLNGLSDNVFNFIWNGTGGQTGDLIYTLTEENTELWVSGESISTTAPAGWANTYAVKLHYNNPSKWSNVYLYTWDGNNVNPTGAWPGSLAIANESNEGWYDYYVTGITSASFNHIWNNNSGSQTSDLKTVLSKPYTELWVVGQTIHTEAPEEWSNKAPVKERDVYVPGTLPGPAWDAASNKMEYLGNGIYKLTFENLPAANYEYKIAIGGTWDENYGAGGAGNGGNIKLCVPYAQDVTIYYSDVTHFAVDTINYIFADITLSGKNIPEGTKLTDEGLTGIYNATVKLPAGTYEDLKLEYNGKTYSFSKFTLAKEKDVTFCMDPLSGLFYHDGSATKVKASVLYFDSKSTEYKSVFGAVATGEEVRFSLTTGTDVTSASLFIKGMENKAVSMERDGEAVNGKQKWSVVTSLSAIGEYDYYFAVSNGADVCVYGDDDGYYGTGKTSGLTDVMPYDLVVYKAGFTTPDWMKNGVIYQIFPDRFFDGDPSNNQAQASARGDVNYEFIEDWSVIPENPEQEDLLDEETYKGTGAYWGDRNWSNEIYGGDLEGITQRIDYLKALGVTVIYLNPVFHSISSHRYDACDYTKIDPILGTEGDFTELVTIAEQNGMTVVLDGVFNHVSDDSIYFDRYYKFIDDGLDTIGAYPYWAYVYDYMAEKGVGQAAAEAAAKQYFTRTYGISDYSYVEWFYVSSEYMTDGKGGTVKDKIGQRAGKPVYTYEGWWGYDSMPVIKSTNGSEYQTGNWAEDIIYNEEGTSVTQYWISRGMDGWRLDVANEVSDETWQAFRQSVKSLDSEAVIIGEIWDDATKYILGDMYDSVMNYQFRNAVTSFAMGSDAVTVTKQMEKIRERYPQEAFYAMMNLVGSHDTSRVLSYLDGIGDDRNDKSIEAAFPTYEKTSQLAKQRQYLVAFLQFTYAGAPTIYYGDEVGVVGCDDPDDRRTFPWGHGAEELVKYYATLAQIRSAYPALRTGLVDPISTGNSNVMGYVRSEGDEVVVVLANNATSTKQVVVDVAKYGVTAKQLQDMLGATVYDVVDGKVTVTVPALKGVILVEEVKAISVDVDALAPAFDEEAAKRPVAPAPTPSTPSTPSAPSETPEVKEEVETPEVAPEETPDEEADVEETPEVAPEETPEEEPEEDVTEDVTTKPEEEEEETSFKDVPKAEKPVEEMIVESVEAWTEIISKVMENDGKANITVQVSGNIQVPANFIRSIAGQNIDVVIEMENGIVWTINSDTVTGNTVDVNFHVDVDTHNIPEDVVAELAEDKTVIQLSLAHSGEFGCQPVLTVPMGSENAGKYANLFYFNEKTGVMEFMTYGLIGEDGKVDLRFIHASEYAVVIDTQIMGAVIDGVDAPLGDVKAGPSPLIFIILIACIAVGAVAICYGFRKKEDRA